MHTCKWCKQTFVGRKRKYCSDVCAEEAHQIRTRLDRGGSIGIQDARLFAPAGTFWCGGCRQYHPEENKIGRGKSPPICRMCKRTHRERDALRLGKTLGGAGRTKVCEIATQDVVEENARQAWLYWVEEKAPDWWLDQYWDVRGLPWRNPRLSDAERYAVRYREDETFRHREIARSRVKKGRRRKRCAVIDDGTVDVDGLLTERKTCPYCGCRLNPRNRTLDHMDPLSRGGTHSAANLVVACRSCNSTKRASSFAEWLERLPESRREVCRKLYESKRGAPVAQSSLPFVA